MEQFQKIEQQMQKLLEEHHQELGNFVNDETIEYQPVKDFVWCALAIHYLLDPPADKFYE